MLAKIIAVTLRLLDTSKYSSVPNKGLLFFRKNVDQYELIGDLHSRVGQLKLHLTESRIHIVTSSSSHFVKILLNKFFV